MPIYIDAAELGRVLTRMPAAQNIMLTGRHGIGKSQILTRYFETRGMKVVTLFLGHFLVIIHNCQLLSSYAVSSCRPFLLHSNLLSRLDIVAADAVQLA